MLPKHSVVTQCTLFFLVIKCPKRHKGVEIMNCIVRIHRPTLTEEERTIREENIKKALIEFYKETHKGEKKNVN